MIKSYKGLSPTIGKGVYIAETAFVAGEVILGDGVNIWPGVSIRGDVNTISIGRGTNVQDGAVIHVSGTPPHPTVIGQEVTIGHNAVVHGATIGDRALIGMGAVVLDGAVVEPGSMVAAGSLVTPGKVVGTGTLWAGSPASEKRPLKPEEAEWLTKSAGHYMELARDYMEGGD